MILIKYIVKEVYKNQLIVLLVLFLVCLCQKFLKMLHLIVDENISVFLIFMCVGLNIPELSKLVIPFSIFISVPITFYKLYIHNEILAMYSCAVDKYIFVRSILLCTGIILIFSSINIAWLAPYCGYYQNKLLSEINNLDLITFNERKFQSLINKRSIMFVDDIQEKKLRHVFLTRKEKDVLTVITADRGNIYHLYNGSTLIILKKGICYEIHSKKKLYEDIFISKFSQYQTCLDQNIKISRRKNEINCMSMCQLLNSLSSEARIEFHWRLTLLISTVIMPVIAMLLFINIVPNYFLFIMLMIFLYVMFFLSHVLLRFYTFSMIDNPIIWMWGVNIFYFIIAGILNLWNSFYIKRLLLMIKRHIYI